MDDLLNEVNSNTCSIASAVEIGSIAKQARQKNLNLENSRNARTLRGPGAFTALFQTALPPPPSRPGDRTGVLKSPPPRAPSVPGVLRLGRYVRFRPAVFQQFLLGSEVVLCRPLMLHR